MALLAFGRERALNFFRRTSSHEHASPAEAEPESTIHTQGIRMGCILLDPKLCSKAVAANIYPSTKGKLCQQSVNIKIPLTEIK